MYGAVQKSYHRLLFKSHLMPLLSPTLPWDTKGGGKLQLTGALIQLQRLKNVGYIWVLNLPPFEAQIKFKGVKQI